MIHIATVNINVNPGSAMAHAFIASLLRSPEPSESSEFAEPAGAAAPAAAERTTSPPCIANPWPGVAGTYAGIARGEDGQRDAHIILLDATPGKDLTWPEAMAWAEALGNGAHVPTRTESALLYANLRHLIDTSKWHWIGEQYSDNNAWNQDFSYGNQDYNDKKAEGRVRAVRRLEI